MIKTAGSQGERAWAPELLLAQPIIFLLYEQEINPYHVKPLNLGGYTLQTRALVYLTNTSSLS